MKKVKITQVKSGISYSQEEKDTLDALGLNKMHKSVVKEATPQIIGMLDKVLHLVKVEEAEND